MTLPDTAPESFEELSKIHMPRVIHDDIALDNAEQVTAGSREFQRSAIFCKRKESCS
jgi:hypothetical protein